jgi:prolyl 4-hydroxylase
MIVRRFNTNPLVVLYEDFLTDDECDLLITVARPRMHRASTVHASGWQFDPGRTNDVAFVSDSDGTSLLSQKIATIVKAEADHFEAYQVVRYARHQEYRPHLDALPVGTSHVDGAGQRQGTLLMYLMTPDEGGETIFPELNLEIPAIRRNAIWFTNCYPGTFMSHPLSRHGSKPVLRGEKWSATKWLRERPFWR